MRAEDRLQREGDTVRAALTERQPDQRRVEQEPVRRRHHGDLDVDAELVLELQRRGETAEVAADDHDLLGRHDRHPIPCLLQMRPHVHPTVDRPAPSRQGH
jgi:hypothetical protein